MKACILFFVFTVLTFIHATGQQAEILKDINPGTGSSYIMYMTRLGDKVFFRASNSGSFNDEPWVTDGTADGTIMLKEINSNAVTGSSIFQFMAFNDAIYFTANDGLHGAELWKTDGTTEGTRMVIDLFPGHYSSSPGELTVINNVLYFTAYTAEYGTELWKTLGDSASTVLVADIIEGPFSSSPHYLYASGGYFYFARENANGLYRSDGTAEGTGIIYQDVILGLLGSVYFTEYKGSIYFRGTDIISPDAKGTQLWRVSGNVVERVTDILSPEADLDPKMLTDAGDRLFFIGEQYPNGEELWAYDGTTAAMVKDINPDGNGNLGGFLTEYKGKLIFSGGDAYTGVELWVSDGTEDGTLLISDILPGALSSGVVSPVKIGDTLYFSADDGSGGEIWRLTNPDGEPSKFTNISDGGAWGPEIIRLGDVFLFNGFNAANGTELWKMKASGLGIGKSIPEGSGISVCPNPARDIIRMQLPDEFNLPAQLNIYNAAGCEIWSQILTGKSLLLNTTSLNCKPGVYLIRIHNETEIMAVKFQVIK